ncbi:hypothetical protein [Streptomyces sp. NPDC057301]|uniref:hypothetical protein n=1 Tax=Streptomyces sp. NPDC057301 TaxID=3346093 RepID=UPI0036265413
MTGAAPHRERGSLALRTAFNAAKHTDVRVAAWWEDNSNEAYSTGLANAAAAFDNYE